MVLLETLILLFTSQRWLTLKYINEVIDHIVEAGIYMQVKKESIHTFILVKSENVSKIICSHIYINVPRARGVLYIAVGICIGSCVHG
jgi:hypothetical protein